MNSVTMKSLFRDPECDIVKALSIDLPTLVSIDDSQRKIIIDALSFFRLTRNNKEEKKILDELSVKTKLNVVSVNGAISSLSFLLNKILDPDIPNDDYEKWTDDLEEATILSTSKEKETFRGIIERIQIIAVNEVEPETKRRRVAQNIGKNFRRISVSVGILPVNEKEYREYMGLLDSDDYVPKVVDTVVSATVNLSIGDNPVENVVFDAEEVDIDKMIEYLRAAKKDIAALKKFIKV